jgi:hypothetical protein
MVVFRTAVLTFMLALLALVVSCTLSAPSAITADDLNRAWRDRHRRPVDEETVTRAWEMSGYISFHLGGGNRLSFERSTFERLFHQECDNRRFSPACDVIENYQWDVRIDDNVNVTFLHKDGTLSTYLQGFACSKVSTGWACMAEQQ